ncbi:MAG TPA: hypothetical protein ENJ30_09890 [Desulfobulbaceae bacterium]|nr:hypothetical protein [Desulfobulbaceae bacterium]
MTEQQTIDGRDFTVSLFSFGYKHGIPEADLVWDVRFLPNPYWVTGLKDRSGLEDDVAAYALDNETGREFFVLLEPLLLFLVRRHAGGKRPQLRIGIGCTGGRHRSVAVVEYLKKFLDGSGCNLNVFHRDIEKQ